MCMCVCVCACVCTVDEVLAHLRNALDSVEVFDMVGNRVVRQPSLLEQLSSENIATFLNAKQVSCLQQGMRVYFCIWQQ